MRIHVFSDNHLDHSFGGWRPEIVAGADAVVCAGDVCEGLSEACRLLRTFIPRPAPIVTVVGNHSFYRRVMNEEWRAGREAAREHDITLLENEAAVIGGVHFVGATLWSDRAELSRRPAQPVLRERSSRLHPHVRAGPLVPWPYAQQRGLPRRCDPHGYGRENARGFDPRLIVEM